MRRSGSISRWVAGLRLVVMALTLTPLAAPTGWQWQPVALAQGLVRPLGRRPLRLPRKPAGEQPSAEKTGAAAPEKVTQGAGSVRPTSHSLDGLRNRNILSLFSRDEVSMYIRGFGRPISYLVILRQLDLTAEQKAAISGISRRIGLRLVQQRTEAEMLDQKLEEAIYDEQFDRPRAEELARRAGEAHAGATRLQAEIETDFREILTADQFFAFRILVGEMLLPSRRLPAAQLRPQGVPRRPGSAPNIPGSPVGSPLSNQPGEKTGSSPHPETP